MVSLNSRFSGLFALVIIALCGSIQAMETAMVNPHHFRFDKAVTERGVTRTQGASLVVEADSRIRFDHGKAYDMRNGVLRVIFTPPAMKKPVVPVLAQRAECLCAIKVHIGRMVTELSDRGVRIFLLDQTHTRMDTVFAEKIMEMTPDGAQKELAISIEDRIGRIVIDGDTLLSCAVDSFDFSLLHIATFGHAFTINEFSLHPLVRPMIVPDLQTSSVLLDAIFYPSRFNSHGGLRNHHFITWKNGRASMQALIETCAPDSMVHDALVALGVKPGNNLTVDTWNKRRSTSSTEPDKRADGDSVLITILYGNREFSSHEVLTDLNRKTFDFRFSGNRAFIPVWKSGCVACLQSCPGSKIANRIYTMRDLERKKCSFKAAPNLPFREGDPVRVRIQSIRPKTARGEP